VCLSQRTELVSIVKSLYWIGNNRLYLLESKERLYILQGQNTDLVNIKIYGTYSYHCTLSSSFTIFYVTSHNLVSRYWSFGKSAVFIFRINIFCHLLASSGQLTVSFGRSFVVSTGIMLALKVLVQQWMDTGLQKRMIDSKFVSGNRTHDPQIQGVTSSQSRNTAAVYFTWHSLANKTKHKDNVYSTFSDVSLDCPSRILSMT
jgi:hypothetical protein